MEDSGKTVREGVGGWSNAEHGGGGCGQVRLIIVKDFYSIFIYIYIYTPTATNASHPSKFLQHGFIFVI